MEFKEAIVEIFKSAVDKFNIQNAPSLHMRNDEENSEKLFGRTAYYDPSDESIVLYVTNRHPKDILRSFAHELVHHHQNERGDLMKGDASSPTYAQDDTHMRKILKTIIKMVYKNTQVQELVEVIVLMVMIYLLLDLLLMMKMK